MDSENCDPYTTNYTLGKIGFYDDQFTIIKKCEEANDKNNPCSVNTCIVEHFFVDRVFKLYFQGIRPFLQFYKRKGYVCEPAREVTTELPIKTEKVYEDYTEIMTVKVPVTYFEEVEKTVESEENRNSFDGDFDNGFDKKNKNRDFENMKSRGNRDESKEFEKITELQVVHSYENQEVVVNKQKLKEIKKINTKYCCGSYPIRRPYSTRNTAKACCGDKTYNSEFFMCCENSYVATTCSR